MAVPPFDVDLNALFVVLFSVILRRPHTADGRIEILTAGAIATLVILRDRPTVLPDLSVIAELERCRKAAVIALEDVGLLNVERHRAHRP